MKREDLKIGDIILINNKGQISSKGEEVTIFKKSEVLELDGVNYYCMIGKTKYNKIWSSDYIKAP